MDICFLCKQKKEGNLVNSPAESTYKKISERIVELAGYNDAQSQKLLVSFKGNITADILKEKKWHLNCYKNITNEKRQIATKKKFETERDRLQGESLPGTSAGSSSSVPATESQLQTPNINIQNCIFCNGPATRRIALISITSDNRAALLLKLMLENEQFRSKIPECKTSNDIIQKPIFYHRKWNANVGNKIRRRSDSVTLAPSVENLIEVEFLSAIEDHLTEGKVMSTTEPELK